MAAIFATIEFVVIFFKNSISQPFSIFFFNYFFHFGLLDIDLYVYEKCGFSWEADSATHNRGSNSLFYEGGGCRVLLSQQ